MNPEAYKLYSNRAACLTKLMAYPEGIKDCDQCIALKPDFAKGYSRKGTLQFLMKDYDKAIKTYEVGSSSIGLVFCLLCAAQRDACTASTTHVFN